MYVNPPLISHYSGGKPRQSHRNHACRPAHSWKGFSPVHENQSFLLLSVTSTKNRTLCIFSLWIFRDGPLKRQECSGVITTFMSSVKRAQLTGQTNQGKKVNKKKVDAKRLNLINEAVKTTGASSVGSSASHFLLFAPLVSRPQP